ncbi:MAG TPA: hypothetical protein VGG14_01335, partial [Candidatus Sulfotelmatobacter sp.]
IYLYPTFGGDPVPVNGTEPDEIPTGWSADGRSIYVFHFGSVPARVYELELASGKRKLWKELAPSDSAGIDTIRNITLASDANAYVYGYIRTLSDLYEVEGLK